MDILQKNDSYLIWVQTLLDAIESNFAMDKKTRKCNTFFEESDAIARAFFANTIKEVFDERSAQIALASFWPSSVTYEALMDRNLMKINSERYRVVKKNLVINYFKSKKVNYGTISSNA